VSRDYTLLDLPFAAAGLALWLRDLHLSVSAWIGAGPCSAASATLAETPYACAFFVWRHDPGYERRPDVRAAIDTIAAAVRGGTSCVRHPISSDSTPPSDTTAP
jgi:hypothetical protein